MCPGAHSRASLRTAPWQQGQLRGAELRLGAGSPCQDSPGPRSLHRSGRELGTDTRRRRRDQARGSLTGLSHSSDPSPAAPSDAPLQQTQVGKRSSSDPLQAGQWCPGPAGLPAPTASSPGTLGCMEPGLVQGMDEVLVGAGGFCRVPGGAGGCGGCRVGGVPSAHLPSPAGAAAQPRLCCALSNYRYYIANGFWAC